MQYISVLMFMNIHDRKRVCRSIKALVAIFIRLTTSSQERNFISPGAGPDSLPGASKALQMVLLRYKIGL